MDPELRDEHLAPPVGSPSATSQGGHNDGARVNLLKKEEEVDQLLEKLRDAEKMMQAEMSRIRLEAMMAREARRRNERISWWCSYNADDVICGVTLLIACGSIGFLVGAKCHENYVIGTLESGNVFEKLAFLTRIYGTMIGRKIGLLD